MKWKVAVGNVAFIFYGISLILLYTLFFSGFYRNLIFLIFLIIVSLELVSILMSSHKTESSVVPYFLYLISFFHFLPSLPELYYFVMIIISFTIFIPLLLGSKGDLSSYLSVSFLTLAFAFFHLLPFMNVIPFLALLGVLSGVSFFIAKRKTDFFSYLIASVLLIILITIPQGLVSGILNMRYQSILSVSITASMYLSFLLLFQDIVTDLKFPTAGFLIFVFTLAFTYLRFSVFIYLLLSIIIPFFVVFILKRFTKSKDVDITFLGFAMTIFLYFYEVTDLPVLVAFMMTFLTSYITIKEIKLKE